MVFASRIKIPVIADSVLPPEIYYDGYHAELYFVTEDDKFGRITFEKIDSIKVCRGEYMPYRHDPYEHGDWVYQIKNSKWQNERYAYEKENYEDAYEFGGNVEEMITDFKHYLFSFHDEFVEVIAKGFWFEQSEQKLLKKSARAL